MDDIRKSIVGILAEPGSGYAYTGTGFLAEGGVLVTCAHVLEQARRDGEAYLFQFDGENETRQAFLIRQSAKDDLDLAVLKPKSLPTEAVALKLVQPVNIRKLAFEVYGYPQKAGFRGRYADGALQGELTDVQGRAAFQIKSEQVEKGFSGAPLYVAELDGVVAIVSSGPGARFGLADQVTAYAIPVRQLEAVYSRFNIQTGQSAAGWYMAHHYSLRPNFTGRAAERRMLSDWLADPAQTLFVLHALGGFGKSALAWHWLHTDVAAAKFPNVVWWSFYEGDASFDNFLGDTLEYLGLPAARGQNPRQQVSALLAALRQADILLVLDGFERALRVFSGMGAVYQLDAESPRSAEEARGRDCVSPAAEDFLRGLSDPQLRGKVLMTTRLCPHGLEGHDGSLQPRCRKVELPRLTQEDAFIFFTQKEAVQATRAEVQAACAPYDYHPLSLNLLAGLIKKDFELRGDIRAAQKYRLGEIKNHKEHILKAAYNTLPVERQQLLSHLACLRGSVTYQTVKTVFNQEHLDEALNDLVERGLLHHATTPLLSTSPLSTFDLHPIVRRYAYDRLTAAERKDTHERLVNYFAAIPRPKKAEKLDDIAPVIELYYHMIRAEKLDGAWSVFYAFIWKTLYYQFGGYQTQIELLTELFLDGENDPPRLKERRHQAICFNELANAYFMSGQPRRAVPLFEMHNRGLDQP